MIYICGDLHGTYNSVNEEKFLKSLSKKDYLIVLGDFGWDWNPTLQSKFNLDCTTLFIDGNHENFDLLNSLKTKDMFGSEVGVFNENTFWLKRGNLYTIEEKTFFCFGGANSIDKEYRLPGMSWWPEEIPSLNEYYHAFDTLEECEYKFDYLITHTCSESQEFDMMNYKVLIKDSTSTMIESIMETINSKGGNFIHHFFGHHHKYVERDKATALYEQVYCLDTKETKFF